MDTGKERRIGWLVVLGLTALWDSISVYIQPSPKEREKEERKDRWEYKCPNKPPPAPTASAVGPCPTEIQIVGRPGTGSLPSTIAPPDYPQKKKGGAHPAPFAALFFTDSKKVTHLLLGWQRKFSSGRMAKPSLDLTTFRRLSAP